MRNRRKTIEALRRLAERPGTPEEGATAQRLLEQMTGNTPPLRVFHAADFPRFTPVWYAYWCYNNERGVIVGRTATTVNGQTWLRIKFDRLKQPRRVPVTSAVGCHISKTPFSDEEARFLYHMGEVPDHSWV